MLRQHDRKLRTLLLLMDIALCGVVFGAIRAFGGESTHILPPELGPVEALLFGAGTALALPLAIRALSQEPSSRFHALPDILRQLAVAGLAAAAVLGAAAFALRVPIRPGPLFGVVATQLACVGGIRLAIIGTLRWLRRSGQNFREVVLVGTGPRACEITETIESRPEWGLRIIGYVDDGDYSADPRIPSHRIFKLPDFPDLLRDRPIDEVIVACPRSMLACLEPVVAACSAAGVPVTLTTDLFGDYLPPPRVRHFGSYEALTFARVHHSPARLIVKRGVDIVGALIGLTIALPPLLLSALAIRLDSKGPILFKQPRCGLNGRTFSMYKLRTMVTDAEHRREEMLHLNEMDGPVFKIRQDPRITRVGHFLRAFSLDELPQLWNVLVGDMSLVGPRPPLPSEVFEYETSERRRLSMRPGLTCLWQVNGRNQVGFDEWVKLDLQYIDNWSLWNDTKILLLTVPTVLRGTGS